MSARPEGGFVVAWTRDRLVPLSFGPDLFAPQAILWRRLRANGAAAGPLRVAFDAGGSGSLLQPRAIASESEALAVWGRPAGLGFLLAGRRLSPETETSLLAACPDGRLRGLRLVPAAEGGWLVWNEACDGLRVIAQRLDDRGRPAAAARILAGVEALVGNSFDVGATPDGGLVGAWTQRVGEDGNRRRLVARSFRADGQPRGPAFEVGPPTTEMAIAAAGNRNLWVVWRQNGPLVVRSFRVDGIPLTPEQRVGLAEGDGETSPSWSNADQGARILVWQRLDADGSTCVARRFDRAGRPSGPELIVATNCAAPAAAMSRRRPLVAWVAPPLEPEVDAASRALARLLPSGAWN